jgi:sugar O-acyltransferase (sialic acid O-acetyltransferase NeuD family)
MSKVILFGAGSQAEVAHFYLTHDSPHDVVAFTVHERCLEQREFHDLPVVPFESIVQTHPPGEFKMFVAIGYRKVNAVRAAVYAEAKQKGYELISYVSSKCTRWDNIRIGDNCFILEDNTLQPFVTIGNDVFLWSGNHIGHHATIGDHCFISSHVVISGHVKVGAYSFIGVNTTIRDAITIGQSCIIGAGSLIMRPCRDREVYVPTRTVKDERTSEQVNF